MIPVPFEDIPGIYNNIGVIFIKWPHTGLTPKQLDDAIKNNSYNAVATNLYLRALNTNSIVGKKTRNSVDIIYSSGYCKNPTILPSSSIVTFNGVADYGIYCCSTTAGKDTHVTLTFSTKDFPVQNLRKYLPKNHKLI